MFIHHEFQFIHHQPQVLQFSFNFISLEIRVYKIDYVKLGDDANVQLLDIRPIYEIRSMGSHDIKGLKKTPFTVAYNGDDKQGFLKKLALKFKEPENTKLLAFDKMQ